MVKNAFALSLKRRFGIFADTDWDDPKGSPVFMEMTSVLQRVARVAEEARLESV